MNMCHSEIDLSIISLGLNWSEMLLYFHIIIKHRIVIPTSVSVTLDNVIKMFE